MNIGPRGCRTRRTATGLAVTLCVMAVGACGGSSSVPSGYRQVSGTPSAGVKLSFDVPKNLSGAYIANPRAGFKTYRALSVKSREAAEVSWGPGSGASTSSLLRALIASEHGGNSLSETISSPHIPGASQTRLSDQVFPGTGGRIRVLSLVALTKSGRQIEALVSAYLNDKHFDPMTAISSLSIQGG
jgi:hypothetical protein